MEGDICRPSYVGRYTREDEGDIPCLDGQPYPPMPDITVTKEGVEKLLKKINQSKACGPDMIPARILRDMAEEISPILATLFQRTIDLGELPEDWKSDNFLPVFKKETDSRHQITDLCH